ncbi:TetR/AcrR family transcriptional regulator [Aurantiacibacter sediminis]|uniref:TetR/AcrR family transcriptional regulator n=1 Tax=Aurantiacibacter sediminis TaxID=2793064 RepID=A0ABS0N5C2_9SPHN|nr:TetR/AcrR family transcriptional regulator [Aurantiacibacter sediminis]MBH5322977.1 TetR/AcrR family transcriptional regulator [Aurantiacibacter sediminis]
MESRNTLIKAAAIAIEEISIEGLTVREVAKRAKQSTIGIYRNFNGRAGLLDALFVQGFERLGTAAREAGKRESDPREAVLAAVREYLLLARKQPQHYRLMFNPQTTGYAPSSEARTIALANYEFFVALVARLEDIGNEARRIAADLVAMVHGHVVLRGQNFGPDMEPQEWSAQIMRRVERQLDLLQSKTA